MRYCTGLGIPHGEFLSWDELDRAKALAWQTHQDRVKAEAEEARRECCPKCGERRADWIGPDGRHIPPDQRTRDVVIVACGACEEAHRVKQDADETAKQQNRPTGAFHIAFGPAHPDPPPEGD